MLFIDIIYLESDNSNSTSTNFNGPKINIWFRKISTNEDIKIADNLYILMPLLKKKENDKNELEFVF